MTVGNGDGNGNSDCDRNGNGNSINNNAIADTVYCWRRSHGHLCCMCVVSILVGKFPPQKTKVSTLQLMLHMRVEYCALWFPPYSCRVCYGVWNWECYGVLLKVHFATVHPPSAVTARTKYCSGAANWNHHQKTMISDFETMCLRQKINFRDGQKQFGFAGSLCGEV